MVLNAAVAWLGNQRMAFGPIDGDNSIIVDTAVTSSVLSPLVSLIVMPAARTLMAPSTPFAPITPKGLMNPLKVARQRRQGKWVV